MRNVQRKWYYLRVIFLFPPYMNLQFLDKTSTIVDIHFTLLIHYFHIKSRFLKQFVAPDADQVLCGHFHDLVCADALQDPFDRDCWRTIPLGPLIRFLCHKFGIWLYDDEEIWTALDVVGGAGNYLSTREDEKVAQLSNGDKFKGLDETEGESKYSRKIIAC